MRLKIHITLTTRQSVDVQSEASRLKKNIHIVANSEQNVDYQGII